MSYGRWQPLADAPAPEGPGLLQVRAAELHTYPTGKSAMVYYGGDDAKLAYALDGFRNRLSASQVATLWVRFAPPTASLAPSEALANSLRQFVARFGAPPLLNQPA